MNHFYSRVPASAVHRQFDGHVYVNIPHDMIGDKVIEDFAKPRMVRFVAPSFIKGGEAYVLFAKRGDALPVPVSLPFGVSVINEIDHA